MLLQLLEAYDLFRVGALGNRTAYVHLRQRYHRHGKVQDAIEGESVMERR